MAAHTPGPWREGPTEGIGQRGKLIVVDANGVQVADCEAPRLDDARLVFARPYAQDTANARLVAAAPELLKAAHAAYHALKSYQYGNAAPALAEECSVTLLDAIAKAEGR